MTQSNEPNDRENTVARQLRFLDRRLTRLENTQLTAKEINECIDGVYQEIDDLDAKIDERFEAMGQRLDRMEAQINGKLDAILQRLTGMNQ
jgi:transposase